MNTEEKIGILAISLLVAGSFMIPALSQTTNTGVVNASVRQTVAISLSGNLTTGILFTNDSSNATLVNITQMSAWNGAMYNFNNDFANGGANTSYWVQNTGSTTNITLCQCACGDLYCVVGAPGSLCGAGDYMLVAYSGGKGVAYFNSTNVSTGMGPYFNLTGISYGFPSTDNYYIIGAVVDFNKYLNLRYWLYPNPANKPTGVYNTSYKILAVESNGTLPSAQCNGNCGC